ncbi:MAG: DUF6263 family protein [Candidatus Hydrogenedentes bacterium]|nr:DUF6263 family protein [Candidatus Hydrogenedentota bacterium]
MRVRFVGLIVATLLATTLGSGCNPDKNKLLFKPQPNAKQSVDTEDVMNFSINLMGVQLGFGAATESSFEMIPQSVDESGTVTLEVIFKSMKVELTGLDALMGSMPGRGASATVTTDDPQGLKAMHAAVKTVEGQSFTATVSKFGEVLEVRGADALSEKAAAAYKAPKGLPSPPVPIRTTFRESLGDDAMKNTLAHVFVARPDKKLRAGDNWQGTMTRANAFVEATQATTFTVKERAGGVVTVDSLAQVDIRPHGDLLGSGGNGFDVTLEISGQGAGTMQFDETTGWLKDWTGTGTIPGNISVKAPQLGSQSLPIELSYKSVVKTVPI